MRRVTLAVVGALALTGAPTAEAGTFTGSATAYHVCDGSTSQTASGSGVYFGAVANNFLPFGTWIEMVRPRTAFGRRYFRVEDRGGPSFLLDFYAPSCGAMHAWGRRTVTFRTLPGPPYRGRKGRRDRPRIVIPARKAGW